MLHNYGPEIFHGSVHIEIPDTLDAPQIDALLRDITYKVYEEHNVILTAVGVYAFNTKDPVAVEMCSEVQQMLREFPEVLQMHGFYVDSEKKVLRFDILISFDTKDRMEVYENVCKKTQELFPDFRLMIVLDSDFSE